MNARGAGRARRSVLCCCTLLVAAEGLTECSSRLNINAAIRTRVGCQAGVHVCIQRCIQVPLTPTLHTHAHQPPHPNSLFRHGCTVVPLHGPVEAMHQVPQAVLIHHTHLFR